MDFDRINYLHYGDSLPFLHELRICGTGSRRKDDLINEISIKGPPSDFVIDVIKGYGGKRKKSIDVQMFNSDLELSVRIRDEFTRLSCRGFSHVVHESINLRGDTLRPDINLRLALMPDDRLHYPPRVRRFLRSVQNMHYRANGYAAIAFALGRISNGICYIFVLQSDLAFRKPAYIREHFRGWRKVLFEHAKRIASRTSRVIFLPSADDVAKCWHPTFPKPEVAPASWLDIYDRTATDFDLSPIALSRPINIQVYSDLEPVWTRRFFAGQLSIRKVNGLLK